MTDHAQFIARRPNRSFSRVSDSGRFLIHYDTNGSDAVSPADTDGNGHPDYVDTTAETFDEVWAYEIDRLGYREPISDGDSVYDVYISDLSSTGQYGVTYPESFNTTTSTFIEIDNNFTDPVYVTPGTDGLRFTAAHEFFHAIQFAYYLSIDATWWYELTATWIQDEVYTDVNDHYSLVNGYLEFPESALYEQPPITFRPYGAMIYGVYLSSVFGEDSIRGTFESLADRRPASYTVNDTDLGLPGGFAETLPRFWIWKWFTGSQASVGRYLPEGDAYATVAFEEIKPIGSLTLAGGAQVQSLGATYVKVNTAGKSGGLQITFDLPDGPTWNLDVLLIGEDGVQVLRPDGETVSIPTVGDYQEVVFVASVLSLEGQVHTMSYTYRVSDSVSSWSDLVGDFDGSGTVGFEDFVLFSGSFGKPAGTHDERCDLDADGRVGFDDFLVFVKQFGESR